MKTLRQVLGKCTEEEAQELAQWWGIGDKPAEGWQHHNGMLVQAMQNPVAVRFAWEQLSEDERKVLHTALNFSASEGTLHDVLFKVTRLAEPVFEAAIETLQEHFLLLEEQVALKTGRAVVSTASTKSKKAPTEITSKLGVPKDMIDALLLVEREIFTPRQDRSDAINRVPTLEQILANTHSDNVYAIGQRYGFMLHDYFSRSDPRARLVGQLVQPEVPYYAWEQFDIATRKLCKWLAEEGGTVSMQAVREHTGYDNVTLAKCIHALENYALAFDTFAGHERKLFVPHELLKNLKKAVQQSEIVEESEPIGLAALDTPPASIRQGSTPILFDLATIIGAMYQQNIEPTQGGYVPKRVANKLAPMLQIKPRIQHDYDQENLTIDMLYNLAEELGLVKRSRSTSTTKSRYEEGPALREWSQHDTQEMTRTLLDSWTKSRQWIDIAGMNFDPRSSGGLYYMDYQSGRKALVEHLQTCVPGRWYTFRSLLRTIKEENPYVLRPRQMHMGIAGLRDAKTMLASWYKVDGEILTGLLASSLYEMGVVALGYDQPDLLDGARASAHPVNPTAFMVTDLGAAILSTESGTAEQETDNAEKRTLIVQPNFELMLLQPDPPTLYSLLPFAQINQVGIVSRLTLTRNSLLRSLELGRNIEQIVGILQEHSQKELPQNVVYTLNDWARTYKEVNISQVYLIEVPSESLANEVVASAKLKSFGLRRLGPCTLIASNDINLQELRRTLEKEGIVVRMLGDIAPHETTRTTTYYRYR